MATFVKGLADMAKINVSGVKRNKTGNGTGKMSHEARVVFIDHSAAILAQINRNASAALLAIGTEAVELINRQMQSGYGKPIRRTGDLMRDVNYQANESENTVDVGNSMEYAPYVHEGTSRMNGRPYIRDALMNGKGDLQEIAEEYLKKGFD